LPGKGIIEVADEYKFTEAFVKVIKKITSAEVSNQEKLTKADMLYKHNIDCIKKLISAEKIIIKNLMDDVFRHYKVED
tara:strand:- start:247 stop:480 length:234 start_codon:yes stop_codon:yes gene_type:complete